MKTKDGQNVFDACMQGYGTLEKLIDFVVDNGVTINSIFSSGQDVIIDDVDVNIQIREFIKVNNLTIINHVNNNDIQVSPTTGIQWPVFVDPAEIINQHLRIVP